MAHVIEQAKSGRAVCKTCQEPIVHGALRFGEEVPNAFSGRPGVRWHHLECAAESKPAQLREALATFSGELPNRDALLAHIERSLGELPPVEFPFAERIPAGSVCRGCGRPIAPGELRIAVEEREDHGTYVRLAAVHLHPGCARAAGLGESDEALIRTHSRGLSPLDLEQISFALGQAGQPSA
jgi:hypothetical protein